MKRILIFGLILLGGCSWGTTKSYLKDSKFQGENYPIRTLRILIVNKTPSPELEKVIQKVSQKMKEEVGIELKVIGYHWFQTRSILGIRGYMNQLMEQTCKKQQTFDIAIFSKFTSTELALVPLGIFMLGGIEDTYRRFIFLRVQTEFLLLHEIYHAFIFNKIHGECVMMSGFYPLGTWCKWLSVEDRKEVLRNKWRDFNIKPELPTVDEFSKGDITYECSKMQ